MMMVPMLLQIRMPVIILHIAEKLEIGKNQLMLAELFKAAMLTPMLREITSMLFMKLEMELDLSLRTKMISVLLY